MRDPAPDDVELDDELLDAFEQANGQLADMDIDDDDLLIDDTT
jgi:hypothetical protein